MREGRAIEIRGTVQGVGFRPWVWRLAHELGLGGRVCNDAAGVHIEAFGSTMPLDAFVRRLSQPLPRDAPPAAEIDSVSWWTIPVSDESDFVIAASGEAAERRLAIPPDLATCEACRRELEDPADRRQGYPFTNCTACGPRFTIALDVPYDRAVTTMAPFVMCPECAAEYEDPRDRRFHAQPNACPACGPRLGLLDGDGAPLPCEPGAEISVTAAALANGLIVAVKGLGGYHLACDATSGAAVDLLRDRKRRREKPFAVMVRDLAEAAEVAEVDLESARLLASPQRPIVLCPRRATSPLSPRVSPDVPLVGVLLPYTPLHHLLLAAVGRPLVMTSGNLSDEPIAIDDRDAMTRLSGIADLFLVHDRRIAGRCDDSVARVIAGLPTVIRRSRGWVPASIRLPRPVPRPILAVGADLKNTFCIARGDEAWLGPHIGDLQGADNQVALEEAIARMARILRVEPEVVAHDLHPGYHSTAWALARGAELTIGVQHHHAHVAAVMAEHGLTGPVLGLAWDGTGWGGDGTAWGGELLLADAAGFQRLATFRPIALPGGDAAVRQIWRPALAALDDAFSARDAGEAPLHRLALFDRIPESHIVFMRKMIAKGLNSPRGHGVGRWFDVVAALAFAQSDAQEEAHAALRLELAAAAGEPGSYPYDLPHGAVVEVDLRPALRAIVWDLVSGRPASIVSARFHNTLIAAAAELVRRFAPQHGEPPVVLAGGCFQNARLTEGLLTAVAPRRVFRALRVPPGDGGIALGQVMVAAAGLETGADMEVH